MNELPASPCVDVCEMDAATGWCAGCLRTIDEIATWSTLDAADKRAVWGLLEQRRLEWRQAGRIEVVEQRGLR